MPPILKALPLANDGYVIIESFDHQRWLGPLAHVWRPFYDGTTQRHMRVTTADVEMGGQRTEFSSLDIGRENMNQQSLAELGIVDTHVHFWRLELLRRAWQPPPVIFRTFEPKNLIEVAAPIGVNRCVLVESGTTNADNRALAEFAASSTFVDAIISYADLESPTLERELDHWAQNQKFRGIRMRFEGHPDPNILTRPSVIEGLRKVAQRGLVFEFLVVTSHLQDILKVYERVPDLKGNIEHMGKPDLRRGADREEWSQYMQALAENTPATCKLSIGPRAADLEEIYANQGQGWPLEHIKPPIQFLLEQFGPDRLMWGSDWPLVLLESDYAGGYQATREALGQLNPNDELRLFRTTALQFYSLPLAD